MLDFKIGDWLKVNEGRGGIFEVVAITEGSLTMPDGWPVKWDGTAINPKFCEQYKGATSVAVYRRNSAPK